MGDWGSVSGLGRFPREGNGNPLQVFLPGESHGQRSLAGYSPWGRKLSDTTERLSTQHSPNLWDCLLLLHSWWLSSLILKHLQPTASYYPINLSSAAFTLQSTVRHYLPLSLLFEIQLYSLYSILFMPYGHTIIMLYTIVNYIYASTFCLSWLLPMANIVLNKCEDDHYT